MVYQTMVRESNCFLARDLNKKNSSYKKDNNLKTKYKHKPQIIC